MDTKDITLAVVMILSSVVLTIKWLTRLGNSADPIIILAAVLLIGSLAAMILLLDNRLRNIEEAIDAKERSLRINLQGVESHIDKKIDVLGQKTEDKIGEFSKRIYR